MSARWAICPKAARSASSICSSRSAASTPLRACNPAAVPLPLRFARATRRQCRFHSALRVQPGGCAASTPLRACNPIPRRLGAARRLCRFHLLPRKARKLSTIQPDLTGHKLEPVRSFRVPECCDARVRQFGMAIIAVLVKRYFSANQKKRVQRGRSAASTFVSLAQSGARSPSVFPAGPSFYL